MTVTLYFKNSERELVLNDVISILTPTDEKAHNFAPISPHYLFFEDNRVYIFEGKRQHVFIRGEAILCATVIED